MYPNHKRNTLRSFILSTQKKITRLEGELKRTQYLDKNKRVMLEDEIFELQQQLRG